MIILLGIASIFLFISIYMFYRAESLSREISVMKRDLSSTSKEKDFYFDILSNNVNVQQSFLSKRFDNIAASCKKKSLANPLDPIHPIVSNFATIFHECTRKPKDIRSVVKNACEQAEKGSYKQLERLIAKQERQIKSLWTQGKITTFVSLIEALMLQQEQTLSADGDKLDKVS